MYNHIHSKKRLLLLALLAFVLVAVSAKTLMRISAVRAANETLTITAPTTFNNAAGVTGVKFIDTTGSSAYYFDPGASTSMVLAGDASIEGNTTIGNASGDTLTANAASWTFANDTNFVLSGGLNGLSFDTSTFSVDATSHRVGIGNTAPGALLDVGLAGSTLGVIRLAGSTSGNVSIQPNAAAGSGIVLTLPATTGTVNIATFNGIIGANGLGQQIATGVTSALPPFSSGYTAGVNWTTPVAGTLANLYFTTSNAQSAGGTLVVTVFINGSGCALTASIAAGGAAGTFSDTTHTCSVSAGDRIRFQVVNNGSGNSASIQGISIKIY